MNFFTLSMLGLTASLLVSASSPARAGDCGEVTDLYTQLGPVRDQGNVGWCYANADADLISFHFKDQLKDANGISHRASAAYIAFINNSYVNSNSIKTEGGTLTVGIGATLEYEACFEEAETENISKGAGTLKEKLAVVDHIRELWDSGNQAWDRNHPEKNLTELNKYLDDLRNTTLGWIPRADFLSALRKSSPWYHGVARNQKIPTVGDSWGHNFGKLVCANRLKKLHARPTDWTGDTKWIHPSVSSLLSSVFDQGKPNLNWNVDGIFDKIDAQLTRRNPVGIDYNANFLTGVTGHKEGWHSSVLVGRRFNRDKGRCEYMIRNSWGPGCYGYTDEINANCVAGNLWVSEKDLRESIASIGYFRR